MKLSSPLSVREGHLFIGSHDTVSLAGEYGTPLYVTDEDRVRENVCRYREALKRHYPSVRLLYAAKANGNISIMRLMASEGTGADVFSSGELHLALMAGMDPKTLLFNGSSKSTEDLALAVEKGVRVSVDSVDELAQLNRAAGDAGVVAEIAFRVNPALEVPTHPKIATGLATSKFGIPAERITEAYSRALEAEHVEPVGMHCHIGSQILDVEPFARSAGVMVDVAKQITDIGVRLKFLDIGGGLGIPYRRGVDPAPTPEDYANSVMPVFVKGIEECGISPELWVEPGRSLVADSTVLLSRVNSVKQSHKRFVNIDAGFNLLLRPAMYDAYHEVISAGRAEEKAETEVTVTGPICETGDIIAADRLLPSPEAGDLIAILDAGAYGFSMSSQYNSRPRCAEVLLHGSAHGLMRRRETIGDLMATMIKPPWTH